MAKMEFDDNSLDMWKGIQSTAIFECKAVYFNSKYFKPLELVICTTKAIRIKCSIKFQIPMEHVCNVKAFFSTNELNSSIISIQLTTTMSQRIQKALKTDAEIDEIGIFGKDTLFLICENLPEGTEVVLKEMFSNFCDITLERAQELLEACKHVYEAHLSLETKANLVVTGSQQTHNQPANLTTIQLTPQDNDTILIYPTTQGSQSLNVSDYMCLSAEEFLNDKIIDFYLKWIQNNVIENDHVRKKTYICSSFFYHVLTAKNSQNGYKKDAQPITEADEKTIAERRHDRVKKWTKNVNILEKDFIIVPINESEHWFLAIICFPNLAFKVQKETLIIDCDTNMTETVGDNINSENIIKKPVILIFDSLTGRTNYRVSLNLREYLTCELKAKKPFNYDETFSFTKHNLPSHRVKVPMQDNSYDCGLFLLQYVEYFFKQPIKDFTIPIQNFSNWFENITVTRKREEIANLIKNLINEQQQQNLLPKFKLPEIELPTKNGELLAIEVTESETIEITESDMVKVSDEIHQIIDGKDDDDDVEIVPKRRKLYNPCQDVIIVENKSVRKTKNVINDDSVVELVDF